MSKLPWIIALVGIGGGALYLRSRSKPAALSGFGAVSARAIVGHPAVFGMGAGIANGLLATARNKPMSLAANLVTASVIGISEGMLGKPGQAIPLALLSALGATAGMAAFTRWDAEERALVERSSVPAPA